MVSIFRIRELEDEIHDLEEQLEHCEEHTAEWDRLTRDLKDKKDELTRLRMQQNSEKAQDDLLHFVTSSSLYGLGNYGGHTLKIGGYSGGKSGGGGFGSGW